MTKLGEILRFGLLFKGPSIFKGGGGISRLKNVNGLGNIFLKQIYYILVASFVVEHPNDLNLHGFSIN